MNHDITHCKGEGCPIKDDCFRYKAHMEIEKDDHGYPYVSYYKKGYICDEAKKASRKNDDKPLTFDERCERVRETTITSEMSYEDRLSIIKQRYGV